MQTEKKHVSSISLSNKTWVRKLEIERKLKRKVSYPELIDCGLNHIVQDVKNKLSKEA